MSGIYLDWAATAPIRPEALEAMQPLLAGGKNASALHAHGRAARAALDDARALVAGILGASPREIVFTATGSEADGLAIAGAAAAAEAAGRDRRLITTAIEHPAVLRAADRLESAGWSVVRAGVSAEGVVDRDAIARALEGGAALVSVMLGNNELGTIQPVAEIAAHARAAGAVVHSDAVQAAGYLDLDVNRLGVDLLSLAGHKIGGPAGAGMLYVRRDTPLAAQIVGGGQELGLRAGTENIAAIAGFARAFALAASERAATAPAVAALRDRLICGILAAVPWAVAVAATADRLPHIASISFPGVRSDAMLLALDLEGVSASAGSACAAGSLEPSYVVAALGLPEAVTRGVIRFSIGRSTTEAEVDRAAGIAGAIGKRMEPTRFIV